MREGALRAPAAGEIVAHAIASGVSQGTELLLYRGEGPKRFDPSLDPDGAQTYPRRYGYAWVGEVTARGDGATLEEGTRVFALASHGDAHVLREASARPLPSALPAERAVLAANLETAITCAWDAAIDLGDRAVVLGGGVVGALTAWLLARSGAKVIVVERSEKRRAAVGALVPEASIVAEAEGDGAADVVVEATGDPRTLDDAIAWARTEGRVVIASFYGARRAPVDLGDAFHRRRLELRASQVSSIPPRLRGRWSGDRRWALVLSLLEEPRLDALLAPPVPFARAAELYAALDREADAAPAHLFVYR
ncbi:MAG: zinc-binding alcohol dehydrogenase [Labilithrix sp.]|nr:zinc-binding alcohol dehydrogenase [Labilithrix sp.]